MIVVRWSTTAAFVTLVATGSLEAQLPGLPTPWQSGRGYFVGPYGAPTSNPANSVYCTDLPYALQYGFPATSYFAAVSPNNATPSGYLYNGLGGQCMSPGQPNALVQPNLPAGNPYLSGNSGNGNLLYSPPAPPTSLGPSPQVAAFQILPQAPPFVPPPPTPPTPPVPPPVLNPHVTPEPATWLLLGTGLIGILGFAAIKTSRA